MRLKELFKHYVHVLRTPVLTEEELQTIHVQCSDFIEETRGVPVFKNLADTGTPFRKVKVRFRDDEPLAPILDTAFEDQTKHLSRKIITVNGLKTYTFKPNNDFYVFPINGYKYIFNNMITDSSENLRAVLEALESKEIPADVCRQLLRYVYKTSDLYEGVSSGAEIIFYNIPFFYAVNVERVNCQYNDLLKCSSST